MSSDQSDVAINRRIALLIDADNISHNKIAEIIAELSKYGTANIRRAYGDWSSSQMSGWREKLHEFAIRPIQQFSYSTGKNATDIALVIDAMELLYTQKLDAFCIASSDGDFTPLVLQLKANGHEVYGFGEIKTPKPFVSACTSFLYLNALDAEPKSSMTSATTVSVQPEQRPKLDGDLITALKGGVAASMKDDGWAPLSSAVTAVKRQGPFDPRNYGFKNFKSLFEATGLFKLHTAPGGQVYAAYTGNEEKALEPTIK
jgi:uncharacterized protein (TIGR00288 family)